MKYFTNDFVQFFKELAANNNRDWFAANKKRYEESVKKPFEVFIADLIKQMEKNEPAFKELQPKECIFRIYKDVRFSKDKTPYKHSASAIVAPGGRKSHDKPGLYVELGAEDARIYGGVYMTEKEQLMHIREHIMANEKGFLKALNSKGFKETYGGLLHGEKNKRLPNKELQAAAVKQPYIANKSFYYFTKLKPAVISENNLMQKVLNAYKDGQPMREFLVTAAGKQN